MNEINDGGPAFPHNITLENLGGREQHWGKGLSLRDYFAAAALQGYLASWPPAELIKSSMAATIAYELADAMLEERKK